MPSTTWSTGWTEALDTLSTSDLASRLGYSFDDPGLARLALTHRSWCAEHAGEESNERLEFLGDAVLGLVVTQHLYSRFTTMPEGELAKVRASVVNSSTLADLARSIDLGSHVLLGKGEEASGGRSKESILADAMEAVIGAAFVDSGLDAAADLILGLLAERIEIEAARPGKQDYKTMLQEQSARSLGMVPIYEVHDSGPDHEKRFVAKVHLGDRFTGEGEGRSKKQAEQGAARAAWSVLAEHFGSAEFGSAESDVVTQEGGRDA